jgi:16S rRNA (adenine1518-N6/adenine1519-N6)-dimethyltransferase
VDSVLVVLERHGPAPRPGLRRLVRRAFAHRRKALARSVSLGAGSPDEARAVRERAREALVALGHPADERAERLSPEEFRALWERVG